MAQAMNQTIVVPEKNRNIDIPVVFDEDRNGAGYFRTDVCMVTFGKVEVDYIGDSHASVWFWSKSGDIVAQFHLTQPVGRRLEVEAGRNGCLKR